MKYTQVLQMVKQAKETANAGTYHTISRGDTMQGLDKRYGLPVGSFEKANPGLDYRRLQIGQRVNMPRRQTPAFNAQPGGQGAEKQPFIGPSDYVINGIMMHESFNGERMEGDIKQGYPYSIGYMHIKEVYPKDRADYEKRRAGRPMTYIPVIDDVNDHYKTSYTAEDRMDLEKSREIGRLYLKLHGRAFYRRYGRNPTDAEYWRMWNGGPSGYKKKNTLGYVKEVQAKCDNPSKWGLTPGVPYNKVKKKSM